LASHYDRRSLSRPDSVCDNAVFSDGIGFAGLSDIVMKIRSKPHNLLGASARPAASGPASRDARKPGVWIEVVRDPKMLAQHVSAWEDLAAHAVEPNVFYEPWMVLPALESLGAGCDLQFVLVFAAGPTGGASSPILCGLFPLERGRRYKSLPLVVLSLWKHLFCSLCTPLVRRGHARETMAAFFGWLKSDAENAALMEFRYINGDGAFSQLLIDHINEQGELSTLAECFTRALLKPATDADEYLRAAISGRHLKEMRRKRSRLLEIGNIGFDVLQLDEDPGPWIDEFLRLEASGWKGEQGTAFACDEAARAFFVTTAREAFRRGRLMMLSASLAGRPIAMKCNFLAGAGAFAFKIAYDESYGRFSPGVMLEIENIKLLHKAPGIEWMDSCAVSTHPMINRLWLDRKTIQTVVVATGKGLGGLLVSALPLMRWAKRAIFGKPSGKSKRKVEPQRGDI
jgi:CelD/BcsL family acetyltransferase involved in cellulose biosynthesis